MPTFPLDWKSSKDGSLLYVREFHLMVCKTPFGRWRSSHLPGSFYTAEEAMLATEAAYKDFLETFGDL